MQNPQHRRSLYFSTWEKLGLFLLGLIFFACNPAWAVAEPPPDLPVVSLDGEGILIHIDEVIPEQSRMAYFLKLKGKDELVEMIFDKRPPHSFRTGAKIRAKGKLAHKKVWVSEVAFLEGESSSSGQAGAPLAEATTGSRRAIVMLLNMINAPYAEHNIQPYGDQAVHQVGQGMFAIDQYSVNSAYEEASLGQLSFPGSAFTDVFVVSIPYDNACAYRTMADQADAVVPVDLGAYQHKVYLVPPRTISGCTWLALGEVGNYGSTAVRKSWSTRIDANAFAHEVGHNLGWHHAATDVNNDGTYDSQYGDRSDLMGYCCLQRKVNSVHVDQIGWFNHPDLQSHVAHVTEAGRYTVAPLGTDPNTFNAPQILKITPATGRTYYLSYRQQTGLDSGLSSTYTTGLNIHRGIEKDRWSYLVKVLKSDLSDPQWYQFHDPANAFTITQIENNPNYVSVDIHFDSSCVLQSPQVTLTPSTQMITDGSQVQPYTVHVANLDTPGCGGSQFGVTLGSVVDGQGAPVSGITGLVQQSPFLVGPGDAGSTMVTLQVGSVPDGPYTLTVQVTDPDATTPIHDREATASVQFDTTPPAPPTNLMTQKNKSKGREAVKVMWDQASDGAQGSGVTAYHVYRNGIALGATSNLSYTDTDFSQTSTNHYEIYAVDAVGHVSSTPGTVEYMDDGGDGGNGGGKGNKGDKGNQGNNGKGNGKGKQK